MPSLCNSLRPRQDGRHFPDDTFKRIFLNENVRISIKISLKFVPKGPINNNPALVQIMAWRRWGDKPLSEPMMISLPTHICVARPQWVKGWIFFYGCPIFKWAAGTLLPPGRHPLSNCICIGWLADWICHVASHKTGVIIFCDSVA